MTTPLHQTFGWHTVPVSVTHEVLLPASVHAHAEGQVAVFREPYSRSETRLGRGELRHAPDACAYEVRGRAENAWLAAALHRARPGRVRLWRAYGGVQLGLAVADGDLPNLDFLAGEAPFAAHPAYPAASFVPGADLAAAAEVARLVEDPRWFQSPSHPHRVTRLCSFLGVGRASRRGSPEKHRRFGLVLDAMGARFSRTKYAGDPRGFLSRAHIAARPGGGCDAAARRYVRLLREVWASASLPGWFDPDLFFRGDPEAAAAWRAHAPAPAAA